MVNQITDHYFVNGKFNSQRFVREMEGKEPAQIQEMYRQALSEFILITRERVDYLIRTKNEILSHRTKRKDRRHLSNIQSKFEQQRHAIRHWGLMNTKFAVDLGEVASTLGFPEGSTFRTLFPELFEPDL